MISHWSKIIVLVLLSCSNVLAQQWYLSPVNNGRNIYSVAVPSRTHIIAAGGNESNEALQDIFNSTSGGMTWNFSNHRTSGYIRSTQFIDDQTGIALGWAGAILKTSNGAANWDSIAPPAGMNQRNFTTVLYKDAQTLFAFGGRNYTNDTMQTIMKSNDGGDNWSVVRDVEGRWLKGACFINANTGFAVGGKGTILKTTDGGSNWTTVNSPVDTCEFNAVYFLDASTGFIAGGNFAQFDTINSTRTLLKTIDGGDNWTVVLNEPGGWLNAIEFSDLNNGYIVGDGATLFKTTNAGNNWVREALNGSQWYSHFTSVKFLNTDFGVIGSLFGEVYLYSNETLPEVQTLPASVIQTTDTSAKVILRLGMNTHGSPVTYNIAYSLTPDFAAFTYALSPIYPVAYNSSSFQPVEALVYNMLPNTTYYYYARATSPNGIVYGDTLTIYTGSLPYIELQCYTPEVNPLYTVFNGNIGNPLVAMNTYFEYGTSTAFGNETQGNPFVIDQPISYPVRDTLSSLLDNTIYYYRLKAITSTDTFYSNTVTFYSGTLFANFEAVDATAITSTSATLNALVDDFGLPLSSIAFQYGTNPNQLSDYVMLEDNYINDSLLHNLSAPISGLISDTVYYFQLVADSNIGRQNSNQHSFYTGNLNYTFAVNAATTVGQTFATLNGFADNFPFSASITFEYGITQNFGSVVAATPATVNDTLAHSFAGFIAPLSPSTSYYYRMKAETPAGFIYSSIETFSTAHPVNYFSTLPAMEVTSSSAQLNGMLNQFSFPVTLSFEYGLTENYGSEIQATPASVDDTLYHTYSASVSGLLADTVYYFRVKAMEGNQAYYTVPRKIYTGEPELPNWDFEQWEPDTLLLPATWNILNDSTFQQVAGQASNYALQISATNFAILGFVGDGNQSGMPRFLGGCPFTERPDSIIFHLNYSLNPLDSAMFLVQMRNGDSIIVGKFFFITGNSGGNFQRIAFPLTYLSTLVPDSIVLGFSTFNAMSPIPNDHSQNFMTLDNISFSPSSAAICNFDFENWLVFPYDDLKQWYYTKTLFINPDDINASHRVLKTEGVEPDGFGVELKNITYTNLLLSSDLSNNPNKDFFGGNLHGTPVSRRYQYLNGYYKYESVIEDSLFIEVAMFKNGVAIGHGGFITGNNTSTYTVFDMPVTYYDETTVPDSAIIYLRNNNYGVPAGFSTLTVDRLSFDGLWGVLSDTTGIENIPVSENKVRVFPNPAQHSFVAEFSGDNTSTALLLLTDINGRTLRQSVFPAGQTRLSIDVADMDAGLYFLKILSGDKIFNSKIVVVN